MKTYETTLTEAERALLLTTLKDQAEDYARLLIPTDEINALIAKLRAMK